MLLHPALARALATAHREDLHRAAARWRMVRLARRVAQEQRGAASPIAMKRSVSGSAARTSRTPADGRTRTETAQAAVRPCQSVVGVGPGSRAGTDRASSRKQPASSHTRTSCGSE